MIQASVRKTAPAPAIGRPSAVSPPEFKLFPVLGLVAYERNARTHSAAQVEQIAASIREFGWTVPVLIGAHGRIIAGHGRLAAARKLGLREVPVLILDYLTPAQRRAYVIADDKLALKVTVEHVHVHAGGQAIVGNVSRPGVGDELKQEKQPHAKQIAHAPEQPMRSADTARERVPVAGDG